MAFGRRLVRLSAPTVLVAVAVAVLVGTPVGAGEPSALVSYGAPYPIHELPTRAVLVRNHLGNTTLGTKPHFRGSTGVGGFEGNVSMPTCSGNCSGEDAIYPAALAFTMPLTDYLPTGGLSTQTKVSFDWTFGWTVDVRYDPGTCTPISAGPYACVSNVAWVFQIQAESITDKTTHKTYSPEGFSFDNVTGPWGPGGPAWSDSWFNETGAELTANGTLQSYSREALPTASAITEKVPSVAAIELPATRKTNHYMMIFEVVWALEIEVGTQNANLSGFSAALGLNMADARHGELFELNAITAT